MQVGLMYARCSSRVYFRKRQARQGRRTVFWLSMPGVAHVQGAGNLARCIQNEAASRWLLSDVRDCLDLDQHPRHLVQVAADCGSRWVRGREPLPVCSVVATEQVGVAEVDAHLYHV